MSRSRVAVDLFNPGQVFACLGFVEVSLALHGQAAGGFDWSEPGNECFWLEADGSAEPVRDVLEFVADAEVFSRISAGCEFTTTKWKVPSEPSTEDVGFPIPPPDKPAKLPAVMRRDGIEISVDHWGDGTRRDGVKFWAGSGGYPGAALLRDAQALVRSTVEEAVGAPFAFQAQQSSSFRFDWRRDYIPIDAGFSLNNHSGKIVSCGYPWVEILAAVGLSHARPLRQARLSYRYGIVGRAKGRPPEDAIVHPMLLRAALGGGAIGGFSQRRFRLELGWPGQEGQARCITRVTEELQT